MPYFIILPLYTLLLAGLLVMALIFFFSPSMKFLSAYFAAAAAGSLVGVIVIHGIVIIIIMGLAHYSGTITEQLSRLPTPSGVSNNAQAILGMSLLFILPFVISGAGIFFGAAAGLWLVYRRRRNSAAIAYPS